MAKLTRRFFDRNPERVAKELLGKTLVRPYRGKRLAGTIDYVKAFAVPNDIGKRYENIPHAPGLVNMWGPQRGYYLLNITTSPSRKLARGVHIVTIEPTEGIEQMLRIRQKTKAKDLTNGPGKLTRALCLDETFDGRSIHGSELFIDDRGIEPVGIRTRRLNDGVFIAEYWLR